MGSPYVSVIRDAGSTEAARLKIAYRVCEVAGNALLRVHSQHVAATGRHNHQQLRFDR